ncbi:MAG: arsenite methyltransferase [Dehalococcoidia bacterium]
MAREAQEIKEKVKERYGALARQQQSCCAPTSCCSPNQKLYDPAEIKGLPQEVSDFSLGCGNPVAVAGLREGEVVLDLGSGGGLDCFLAAQRVGEQGRVIGLDMSPDMLALARQNAGRLGATNVEFRSGEMEAMPVESASVDVIISNCVINLSPDKDAVFREAFRVLKPGGRLSVSDIVLVGELDPETKESLEAWASCVAGALPKDEYLDKLRRAGFVDLATEEKSWRSSPAVSLWVSATRPA